MSDVRWQIYSLLLFFSGYKYPLIRLFMDGLIIHIGGSPEVRGPKVRGRVVVVNSE